ncbi:hypothetical protein Trydic_g14566 [Trypoxylus dichotomus]
MLNSGSGAHTSPKAYSISFVGNGVFARHDENHFPPNDAPPIHGYLHVAMQLVTVSKRYSRLSILSSPLNTSRSGQNKSSRSQGKNPDDKSEAYNEMTSQIPFGEANMEN